MGGLQVQYQLSGRPTLLAGSAGAFLNGRAVVGLAGPVTLPALTYPLDVLQPRSIGSDIKLTMSAGNASLGHVCVSPACVEDHSTPEGSDECSIAIAQSRKGKLGR